MSTCPSPLTEELAVFTREHVAMSVMLSGPLVGSFLGFLVSLLKARCVLEIGTYTGYSALCMAERLPVDGHLITLDINRETTDIARRFWGRSEGGKKIELRLGDAMETLAVLPGPFDLVFIDADKPGYPNYLEACLPKLSPLGVIVADNALFSGEVVNPVTATRNGQAVAAFNDLVRNNPQLESVLLPVRDGLNVIRRRA
ncbi:MAG: O-methyltransferase [Deltaproteobacteria bacterium]|nr:O-methyltransferase [Deltaproteobacteria bacterium]MBI3293725.1 O-methyltransferase [Deltaproteobacteria bacterium]